MNLLLPKVFAITLNWNRKDDTVECVDSLLKLNYPNYEIVVVDNGSTDGTVELLKEKFDNKITIIENKKNLGYADGFNSGIYYAFKKDAEYMLILNNDTKIDPDALIELVKVAENDSKIGFVSGKVYNYNDPNRIQTVGKGTDPIKLVGPHVGAGEIDNGQYDEIKEYEFIDDVFLLVRKEVIEKVGGYDPNFFLYWEETDWCARVRKADFKIFYTPDAKIWHKGSMSSGGGTNPLNTYYMARNKYVFIKRNGTNQQFKRFVLKLFFVDIPKTMITRLVKAKLSILFGYLKGNVSGIIWILQQNSYKQ